MLYWQPFLAWGKNHNAAFMVGLQTIMVVESANDGVIMTM